MQELVQELDMVQVLGTVQELAQEQVQVLDKGQEQVIFIILVKRDSNFISYLLTHLLRENRKWGLHIDLLINFLALNNQERILRPAFPLDEPNFTFIKLEDRSQEHKLLLKTI